MWIPIKDEYLQHVWKCEEEDCTADDPTAIVSPDWYQDNGTPVCVECDRDMIYQRTELNIPKTITTQMQSCISS